MNGEINLQAVSISVIMFQTPNELDEQHIYVLDASDDLPLGLIPLAVDHKNDPKYPKLLSIPVMNTTYEIESTKVSKTSWNKSEESHDSMKNSSTELPTIPSDQASNQGTMNQKGVIILQETQVPQEGRDKLSISLENKFHSIVSRSSTDVGGTNLFKLIYQLQNQQ